MEAALRRTVHGSGSRVRWPRSTWHRDAQVAIAAVAVPLIWWLFRGLRSERVGVPLASVSVACMAAVWVGSRLAG